VAPGSISSSFIPRMYSQIVSGADEPGTRGRLSNKLYVFAELGFKVVNNKLFRDYNFLTFIFLKYL